MLALLQGSVETPFWDQSAMSIVFLLIGLVALLSGAHMLVSGASSLARGMGISPLVIGLTVVAFGTSAPELALNVMAAANSPEGAELAFGNVVGSNIANVGLVLALACLILPLHIRGRVLRQDIPMLLIVSIAFVAMAWWTPGISATEGIVLLGGMLVVTGFWFALARKHPEDELVREATEAAYDSDKPTLWRALGLTIVGLALLLGGARGAEYGAISIARWVGMSEAVIGLTIVAVATSLPEIATAIIATRRREGDIAVGTVIGSNLFNILLVLGVTSIVRPVPLPEDGSAWTLLAMLGFTLALLAVYARHHTLGRAWGGILLAAWIATMILTITWSTGGKATSSNDSPSEHRMLAPGVLPP